MSNAFVVLDRESGGFTRSLDRPADAHPAQSLAPAPSAGRTSAGGGDGLDAGRFSRVHAYMAANLDRKISLAALARVAGSSRFHFARQFRRRAGASPMAYMMQLRIDAATSMLGARPVPFVDVAAELGFSDQSHFTRTFRRYTGVCPREFVARRRVLRHA